MHLMGNSEAIKNHDLDEYLMIWGKCHNTMLSEIKQMGQKQCDMLAYHIMICHIIL